MIFFSEVVNWVKWLHVINVATLLLYDYDVEIMNFFVD